MIPIYDKGTTTIGNNSRTYNFYIPINLDNEDTEKIEMLVTVEDAFHSSITNGGYDVYALYIEHL